METTTKDFLLSQQLTPEERQAFADFTALWLGLGFRV